MSSYRHQKVDGYAEVDGTVWQIVQRTHNTCLAVVKHMLRRTWKTAGSSRGAKRRLGEDRCSAVSLPPPPPPSSWMVKVKCINLPKIYFFR